MYSKYSVIFMSTTHAFRRSCRVSVVLRVVVGTIVIADTLVGLVWC